MGDQLFSSQYITLRGILDEVRENRKNPQHTDVRFSKFPGTPPGEPVLFSELIYSTLSAVSNAQTSLKKSGGLTLTDAPLEFKFSGELMGVTSDYNDILLHINLAENPEEEVDNG